MDHEEETRGTALDRTERGEAWKAAMSWVVRPMNAASLLTLGGGFLYLIGSVYFSAYFGVFQIPSQDVSLSLPTYMVRGAIIAVLPLSLMGLWVYEGIREQEGGLWSHVSNTAVLFVLLSGLAVLYLSLPQGFAMEGLQDPSSLGSAFWFFLVAFLLALALGATIAARSIIRFLVIEDFGWVTVAAVGLLVLAFVPQVMGAAAAEEMKRGGAGAVSVEFTPGSEAPWGPDGPVYHILTHDSRFYFFHVWKVEEGAWDEALHIIPQERILSVSTVGDRAG